MNVNFEHLNALPVPTWSWLGINSAALQREIPSIAPYSGQALSGQLPEGVIAAGQEIPLPPIETGAGDEAVQFVRNNRSSGIALHVPAGHRIAAPIFLNYRLDAKNPAVADWNTVVAGEGSEITVVMNYSSEPGTAGFHGGVTRLFAAKNAVIHLVQVQLLGDECTHFDDIGAIAEENAEINVVQAELGAQNAFAGCRVKLAGRNSRLNLESIYFGDRSRSVDINYVAEHTGVKSQSEIHVNGALLDESKKTFRGTIDFARGAKQAVGHESEYNLLFSPRVRNMTAPLILCGEEDVEGQHAATTGKIDEQKLFYLMSRGLDELTAKKMVIEAQFQPAVEKIPEPGLRSAISDFVKERLNQIESLSE